MRWLTRVTSDIIIMAIKSGAHHDILKYNSLQDRWDYAGAEDYAGEDDRFEYSVVELKWA